MCHQPRQRVLAAVLVAALVCGTWARPFAGFGKDNTLRVLAIGDSITQGSVPSKNMNHPYTIQLQQQLQQAFPGRSIDVDNAGEVQIKHRGLATSDSCMRGQTACPHDSILVSMELSATTGPCFDRPTGLRTTISKHRPISTCLTQQAAGGWC